VKATESWTAPNRYGWSLIALHWLMAMLIVGAYVVGSIVEDMDLSPLKLKLLAWHKWVGLLVLFLVPLRGLVRYFDPLDHRLGLTPWERQASTGVHGLIYALLLVAPLVGWLYSSAAGFPVVWFGVWQLPDLVAKNKALAQVLKELHEGAVNLLMFLVVLHAAAALYHHHVRRDGVLARMVPWSRRRP